MKTKLTLRLNEDLIKNAKEYSAKSGKPISKIVADLFTVIKNEKLRKKYKITPAVKSLKGILRGKKIDESDYKKHLEEKHL
ncbi:hypothetical protein BMS3Bbin06_01085 [bacterium BMS3Bbin06]|nr:hypothetical protein BMS3Abin08_02170 [bacterium BMS3Abin08]GBE34559.1 hypothetical protein BMS3Bbin06_01085 [bacterium BMS3Bbin06]